MLRITLLLLPAVFLVAGGASAGPERFESRGYIENEAGMKCWYRQDIIKNATHFHGPNIASTVGEMTFDDPACMTGTGNALDANKSLVNKVLATWYSHPDADFDTENLRKTSLYQEVGECMQAKSYAAIGIAIDFVIENGSIVKVFHGPTLEGCLS